jgi:hypothetical protein
MKISRFYPLTKKFENFNISGDKQFFLYFSSKKTSILDFLVNRLGWIETW